MTSVVVRRGVGFCLFAALLVLVVLGGMIWPDSFFPAYWMGLMFWVQLSVGCLMLLLVQLLSGGAWGVASAPPLRAGATALFLMVPFFIPVLFALPHVFSWTNIQAGVSTEMLVNKRPWLNSPAFIVRTIFYLVVLGAATWAWRRPELRAGQPGTGWSGPVLVFVILVMSFASCDWMMSLEPSFYSSLYPFMYFAGAMVSTLAGLCALFSWQCRRGPSPEQRKLLHALGKLLFAAVLFWGYIVFSQFIIIWTGNLPQEADWYVVRGDHGWQWLTAFVMIFHFAVPFCLLLSERLKKEPLRLFRLSVALFVIHFVEIYWMMAPKRGVGFYLNPFDLLLPLLIGACWIWFVAGRPGLSLKQKPSPEAGS